MDSKIATRDEYIQDSRAHIELAECMRKGAEDFEKSAQKLREMGDAALKTAGELLIMAEALRNEM